MSARTTVHLIAGARPNFMKIGPAWHALKNAPWCWPVIVHTGQHYDANMSADVLADLGLPEPDHHLNVGSASHAAQTAAVMIAYEKLCLAARPDWTVVVGDVNSTLAATLVAAKLGIPVAHLEAGLRSRDRTMPEEVNRLVTDVLADLLWTPSADADENLLAEGVPATKIARIGNIMIDSFERLRPRIEAEKPWAALGLAPGRFGVVTLHRPSNVDEPERLAALVDALCAIAGRAPLVFPIHPRTRARLEAAGLMDRLGATPGLHAVAPLSYIAFMGYVVQCAFALTDSGGIQEETSYLGIPCLTLRPNTERPITLTQGTNRLVTLESLSADVDDILSGAWPKGAPIPLWDGRTAERLVASLEAEIGRRADA